MKNLFSYCLLLVVSNLSIAADEHPLLSKYPDARVRNKLILDYASFQLPLDIAKPGQNASDFPTKLITGDLTQHYYVVENVSSLKIYKNYQQALNKLGFSILFNCETVSCGDPKYSEAIGNHLSVENKIYNYRTDPYILIGQSKGAKGNIFVALYIGRYEGTSAIQQVIIEEEALETGLVKIDAEY